MTEIFTVHHGKVYRAHLKLNWFESFASEEQVAEKFREIGFTNIHIVGHGSDRYAVGTWNGPDESVPLTDEHIVSVQEVHDPQLPHGRVGSPFSPLGHEEIDDTQGGGG